MKQGLELGLEAEQVTGGWSAGILKGRHGLGKRNRILASNVSPRTPHDLVDLSLLLFLEGKKP
jgi:hypothetical protein